ncbi:MAG: regulatory protein RecX [Candidatus Omnitrophica bacterium]|nr:regulatory protein RecX [Candidatus Omnitrophota bacterium]
MRNNKESALAARAYAFLLLKYRQRSVKEISGRLRKKKFSEEIIKETLDFLREKKFIDDPGFARAWIKERLVRGIGPRRLFQELKLKGIDKQVIESHLSQAKEYYSETETIRSLAERRFNSLKDLDQQTAKRRVYAFLLRRGFSPDAVIDTVNQYDNS